MQQALRDDVHCVVHTTQRIDQRHKLEKLCQQHQVSRQQLGERICTLLVQLTDTKNYAMVLYTDHLKVIHVTTHIALRKFLDTLKGERIHTVIGMADSFLCRVGFEQPRIAVAGVNPHAGENGLFGDEEITTVASAINAMKAQGINVYGPSPPDTVFLQCQQGQYDIVVADVPRSGEYPAETDGLL